MDTAATRFGVDLILSAKCREPLCGPPFLQVAADRKGQRYAFNQPTGMRSYSPDVGRSLSRPLLQTSTSHPTTSLSVGALPMQPHRSAQGELQALGQGPYGRQAATANLAVE